MNFEELFNNLPIRCLVVDSDIRIVACSSEYLMSVSKTREDVVGLLLWDAFPANPNDPNVMNVRRKVEESYRRVMDNRTTERTAPIRYDVTNPFGAFETRWWAPVHSYLRISDGSEYIYITFEDVTKVTTAVINIKKLGDSLLSVSNSLGFAGDVIQDLLSDLSAPG